MTSESSSSVELATRDGRLSEIASLAKRISWDPREARSQFQPDQLKLIPATVEAWKSSLRPLKMQEPKLDGYVSRQVKMAFVPLGAKMRPDMAEDKAEVWAGTIVAAMSDLPPRCIVKAMGDAIHQVFEFPSQMEAYVRGRAESHRDYEYDCIKRLRDVYDLVFGRQQELLPAEEPGKPMTADEIRQLVRETPRFMLKAMLGLGQQWMDAKLVEAILKEEQIELEDEEP